MSVTLFYGGNGSGFDFEHFGSKVHPLNSEDSDTANRISRCLQFINFQKKSPCTEMKWGLFCLVREAGAWDKGRVSHWQQHKKAVAPKKLQRCTTPLLMNHPEMKNNTILFGWKAWPLNGSIPKRGPNPTVQTGLCLQRYHYWASKQHDLQGTCYTDFIELHAALESSHRLSLAKVGQSHGARNGVLKINEDIAQVNQLTKYAYT